MARPWPKQHRLPSGAYEDESSIFHLVLRAFPLTAPFRGSLGESVWQRVLENRGGNLVEIGCACLMPDHLHLVASPRARPISSWVGTFKSFTTRESWKLGHDGRVWQPSFYDRAIREEDELGTVIEYVRRNPVEAGLVEEDQVWKWQCG